MTTYKLYETFPSSQQVLSIPFTSNAPFKPRKAIAVFQALHLPFLSLHINSRQNSLLCLSFVTKLNAFEVQSCIHVATFCFFLLSNSFLLCVYTTKCFNLFTSRWIFGLFPISYDYDQRYYEHSQAQLCIHMLSFLLDKF